MARLLMRLREKSFDDEAEGEYSLNSELIDVIKCSAAIVWRDRQPSAKVQETSTMKQFLSN